MKKKILSLMLMVSLAASLAACGQDSGKNSNSTDCRKQSGSFFRPDRGGRDDPGLRFC